MSTLPVPATHTRFSATSRRTALCLLVGLSLSFACSSSGDSSSTAAAPGGVAGTGATSTGASGGAGGTGGSAGSGSGNAGSGGSAGSGGNGAGAGTGGAWQQDDRIYVDRDPLGTPFIYARDLPAAAHGLGYSVAQDHAQALVRLYLLAQGRLSEFDGAGSGERNLYHDMRILGLRLPETSAQFYPAAAQELRDYLDGYAAGINRYLDEHRSDPDLSWIGSYTVSGLDIFALDRMRIVDGQFTLAQAEMARFGQTECPQYFYEDQSGASNAWAVGAPLAPPGQVMLSGDPHLPWQLDPLEAVTNALDTRYWYELHMLVGERRLGGGVQLGEALPGPGYTDYVAYSGTHSGADYADVYHLTRPQAHSYQLGSETLQMTSRSYQIQVRGRANPTPFTVYDARLGPVFCVSNGEVDGACSINSEAFSVVLPSIDHEGSLPDRWKLLQAQSMDAVVSALQGQAKQEGNVIVATRDGEILYHLAARIPERESDVCYGLPLSSVDGAKHTFDASGQLVVASFGDHPLIRSPGTGYVVNNNATPQSTTAGIGGTDLDWHNGLFDPTETGVGGPRQMVAREYFDGAVAGSVTPEASMALAMNTEVILWRAFAPILDTVIATFPEILSDADVAAAVAALAAWDGIVASDSEAVLVFLGWTQRMDRASGAARVRYRSPPSAANLTTAQLEMARDALVLDRAVAGNDCEAGVVPYLSEAGLNGVSTAAGALVPWGDVHRMRLPGEPASAARSLPMGDKLLQTLFMGNASTSCPDFGIGEGEGGSSILMHVSFTPELKVHLVKPATNLSDPDDPRYGAMADLYASGQYREVVLDRPGASALVLE